jgi:hypothetical protein
VLLTAPGANSIAVSTDHGVTWAVRQFATPLGGLIALSSVANYANGRFIVQTSQPAGIYTIISTDLIGWLITADIAVNVNGGQDGTFAYKGGVYLHNPYASITTAFTLTEDATYMRLPYTVQTMPFNKTEFIKVA